MCKKSGGIVIIHKSKLENCLSFIQRESQFVQWVIISNVAFDLQNDSILGCVFVPPEGSKYSNSESFDEIEKELIALSKDSNMYSAIVGDFNAKTGTLNDFIITDERLLDLFNFDCNNDVLSYMLDYENLENQGVPFSRVSQCSCQKNNYGFKLLYPRSPEGKEGILFYLCPSVRPSVRPSVSPRYFLSHFSQQLSMAEICYLITSFI
jgi:hypothetical protein